MGRSASSSSDVESPIAAAGEVRSGLGEVSSATATAAGLGFDGALGATDVGMGAVRVAVGSGDGLTRTVGDGLVVGFGVAFGSVVAVFVFGIGWIETQRPSHAIFTPA
jgi:hypothetical protein